MYLLPALAAGLVRCIYIDRLDKLSEGIGGQLREGAVPLYPLNKLLYILCLLFLFMNLLLQTFDLGFEVFLFLGVVPTHHGESFIIQPTGYIVLVNTDKKTVKLSDSLLSLCQPLLIQPQQFLALYTELLLHFLTEICLIASNHRYDLLDVLPDELFQHDSPDIMFAALVLAGTMAGADEEVLPLFKIAGGGVVELLLAVVAEHQTGEHIALPRRCFAVPLLPVTVKSEPPCSSTILTSGSQKADGFFTTMLPFLSKENSLLGIVGAWLDLGIRVRIGKIKRADFTVLLAVIKIIVGENLIQFLVGQFDDLIVFFFRIHFVKPPLLSWL